jgi:2-C-methyl-D-erythritol 4-phosphate cytidylyltransferase
LCAGGPRRQDSVRLGLEKLDPECQVVVIHDGVRPFVSPGLIDRAVDVAREKKAVVVGVPVRNTVKVVSALGEVINTLERDSLWEIQTPQVFSVDIIREAYDRGAREGIEATDDAMLVERLGVVVTLLRGETTNIKITFPEDILFAEALLREGRVAS